MKTVISPLGFETNTIVSFIAKDGIGSGDRVIILRPKESPDETRGDKAYSETKDLLNSISNEIELDKMVLDTKDFEGMILEISNVINDIEGELAVNLSGGARILLVALTTVTIFHHQKIDRIYNHDIVENSMKKIDLPYVEFDLTKNEKELMDTVLKTGPSTYNELVDILGFSKSTVSRLSNLLQEKSLLKISEKGKQMEVCPSLTGKLID